MQAGKIARQPLLHFRQDIFRTVNRRKVMTTFVHTLNTVDLNPESIISVNPPVKLETLSPSDPATMVMTDLTHVRAITIKPDDSIEFASKLMEYAGIRMLVVTDPAGSLLGLVTARDILGEKPMNIMARDKVNHHDIQVKQIMTTLPELDPLQYREVEHATIEQVILNLRDAGRQHAIVIDDLSDDSGQYLRGIFSATQIGRMLGIEISAGDKVQTFADFERLIAEL